MSSILHDDPPRIDTLRPGLPPALSAIVQRLLAKGPDDRYSTAAALSEDLRAVERSFVAAPPATAPVPARMRRYVGALAVLVTLAALAYVGVTVVRTRTASQPQDRASVSRANAALTRIAVLPFTNLGAAEDEYFAAGITDEITSRLAGVSRLAVPSSTTLSAYDRRGKTLRQIGSDLGVAYLLEGTVRWAPRPQRSRARITPKLVRVADDTTVWTHPYDATLSDVFQVQSDIAYQITGALKVALEAHERRTIEARPTADEEAYLLYLKGLTTFQHNTSDTGGQAMARASLEQAVQRDPSFALAWAWLSRVYATQYQTGMRRLPETREAANAAVRKALSLDAALPAAHLAQANLHLLDRNYDGARRALDTAAQTLTNSADLFRVLGNLERRRGNWRESLAVLKQAYDIDPGVSFDMVVHYLNMRQYREAERYLRIGRATTNASLAVAESWIELCGHNDMNAALAALERDMQTSTPEDSRVRGQLAKFAWFAGQHERALRLIEGMDAAGSWQPVNFRYPASLAAAHVYETLNQPQEARARYQAAVAQLEEKRRVLPDDYQVEAALGLAYAGLGRAADAVRHARRATELLPITKDAHEGPLYVYLAAQVHARLGQHDEAFVLLDSLFDAPGFYNPAYLKRDPGFATLRGDPRFAGRASRWASRAGDALLK